MISRLLTNPYLAMLRTAWRYARGERTRYLVIYGLFTLSNLLAAGVPLIWGWFINDLQQEGTAVLASAWKYVGAYLFLHFGGWAFHGPARVLERKLAFNLSRNYLQEVYHQSLHLPVKWHQDNHSGATINRVRKAYEALKEFFENGFMYLHALMKFVFSFAAMIYFAPIFGLVAVGIGALAIFTILRFDKPFLAALRETNEREHVVSSTLFDSLSNIITVITLRLEQRMESGLFRRVMEVFPPFRRKVLVNEWKWFVVDGIVAMIYVVILMGYLYQNWHPGQVLLIGGLVTLMGYVERFTSVFHDIAWQYTQVVSYHADVQTAENILEAYRREHLPESDQRLPANWQEIAIEGLSFRHQTEGQSMADHYHGLQDINLRIRRGQRIAFIGESGSGKSTLLALLRGLYPLDQLDQLAIDGQPVPQGWAMLNNQVTLCPQEPEIFENTIAYNITLGLPFTAEEVDRVCQMARFHEVITQLPEGLESNIKEKGVNLSGGQKQRLALARGILAARDSQLVLLDEPTSSVDPKTELKIYEGLFKEFSDKAIISSLHRLHLLPQFDYIYLMDQGRIIAEGTFSELRLHNPAFQEMWRHQEELSV